MTDKAKLLSAVRASVEAYCAASHDFSFDPANPVVRLHEPTFSTDEINAALDCMLTTQVTMGAKVKQFERAFSDHYGWSHGVMSNSASSPNFLPVPPLPNPETKTGFNPGATIIV